MAAISASGAYAALRQGGASAPRARIELALAAPEALRLERLFLRTRPRAGRDAGHVAAVLAEGGFPELPEPGR